MNTTPLIKACEAGNATEVARLIASRADVNKSTNHDLNSPMLATAIQGSLPIAKALLKAKASVGTDPLLQAALRGDESMVRLLLPHVEDHGDFTVLHAAAMDTCEGLEAATELLLDCGADQQLDDRCADGGTSALLVAVVEGNLGVARALVRRGADVEAGDEMVEFPLDAVDFSTQPELAMLLVRAKAAVVSTEEGDGSHITRFAAAARGGHVGLLREMLRQVDPETMDGWTALMQVAAEGSPAGVKTLLELCSKKGVETAGVTAEEMVNKQAWSGRTALMAAAHAHAEEAASLLLRARADLWAVDREGRTALMAAVSEEGVEPEEGGARWSRRRWGIIGGAGGDDDDDEDDEDEDGSGGDDEDGDSSDDGAGAGRAESRAVGVIRLLAAAAVAEGAKRGGRKRCRRSVDNDGADAGDLPRDLQRAAAALRAGGEEKFDDGDEDYEWEEDEEASPPRKRARRRGAGTRAQRGRARVGGARRNRR
jgi:ankyrin repeat protein